MEDLSAECHLLVARRHRSTYPCFVVRCEFCSKPASGLYPATRLLGNPVMEVSWERGLAAMCGRCWKVLMDAGSVGRTRKGSQERWWLGHDVGKKPRQ
jgi:hypothetical protein